MSANKQREQEQERNTNADAQKLQEESGQNSARFRERSQLLQAKNQTSRGSSSESENQIQTRSRSIQLNGQESPVRGEYDNDLEIVNRDRSGPSAEIVISDSRKKTFSFQQQQPYQQMEQQQQQQQLQQPHELYGQPQQENEVEKCQGNEERERFYIENPVEQREQEELEVFVREESNLDASGISYLDRSDNQPYELCESYRGGTGGGRTPTKGGGGNLIHSTRILRSPQDSPAANQTVDRSLNGRMVMMTQAQQQRQKWNSNLYENDVKQDGGNRIVEEVDYRDGQEIDDGFSNSVSNERNNHRIDSNQGDQRARRAWTVSNDGYREYEQGQQRLLRIEELSEEGGLQISPQLVQSRESQRGQFSQERQVGSEKFRGQKMNTQSPVNCDQFSDQQQAFSRTRPFLGAEEGNQQFGLEFEEQNQFKQQKQSQKLGQNQDESGEPTRRFQQRGRRNQGYYAIYEQFLQDQSSVQDKQNQFIGKEELDQRQSQQIHQQPYYEREGEPQYHPQNQKDNAKINSRNNNPNRQSTATVHRAGNQSSLDFSERTGRDGQYLYGRQYTAQNDQSVDYSNLRQSQYPMPQYSPHKLPVGNMKLSGVNSFPAIDSLGGLQEFMPRMSMVAAGMNGGTPHGEIQFIEQQHNFVMNIMNFYEFHLSKMKQIILEKSNETAMKDNMIAMLQDRCSSMMNTSTPQVDEALLQREAATNAEIEALKQREKRLQLRLESIQDRCDEEISVLRRENVELTDEIDRTRSQLRDSVSKNEFLQSQLDRARGDIEKLEISLDDAKAQESRTVDQLKRDLKIKEQTILDLQSTLNLLQAQAASQINNNSTKQQSNTSMEMNRETRKKINMRDNNKSFDEGQYVRQQNDFSLNNESFDYQRNKEKNSASQFKELLKWPTQGESQIKRTIGGDFKQPQFENYQEQRVGMQEQRQNIRKAENRSSQPAMNVLSPTTNGVHGDVHKNRNTNYYEEIYVNSFNNQKKELSNPRNAPNDALESSFVSKREAVRNHENNGVVQRSVTTHNNYNKNYAQSSTTNLKQSNPQANFQIQRKIEQSLIELTQEKKKLEARMMKLPVHQRNAQQRLEKHAIERELENVESLIEENRIRLKDYV